jgi:DNA-binding response OmpR family regulator
MMPRLDGMQLLARLRANPETSTLPIILLSARASEESSVEGMQAGADDYLIKPFSARELLARVEAQVKIARLRRASERALRDEQEHWNLAAHVGRFGQWHLDLVTNAVDLSTSCKANFGLGPEEQASAERIFTLIHPDDHEQVTARLRQAMSGTLSRSSTG